MAVRTSLSRSTPTPDMADAHDKENVAPLTSSDPLHAKSPSKRGTKKGRSKSIGPGDLLSSDGPRQDAKQDAKNRRKSTYVPATKSIISTEQEKKERQAARRRTLANRRVSFAPEATLHTWDVIEFMRDPTTSTDASDQTRRASNIMRSSNGGSPLKQSPGRGSEDEEPPSTPPEQEDEPESLPGEPDHQRDLHKKQRRRSSGIPPMNFNNPEDFGSSSGMSGSSDVSSSDEGEDDESEDATGTAMSLDMGEETAQSLESGSSTSSSARLDAALRQAANAAGTRGIEYDEYGDEEVSMEMAGDEITNAFKPWAQRGTQEPVGSAFLDQENVNPFSPAFKAELASGTVYRPETVEEENTGEMSMDVTRAVGGIMKAQQAQHSQHTQDAVSSPLDDGTMDFTQAVGKIYSAAPPSPNSRSGQKRRRSTTAAGSPGVAAPAAQNKRRRSSVARSSMGDDTMELTMVMGGIQKTDSPAKPERRSRRSVARRRSSGVASEQDEATMDFTQAVGGIKGRGAAQPEHTTSSFDENEELTMELTTVLGGIKPDELPQSRPMTPQNPSSPVKANSTPKDQERYMDAPDSGPIKLLTPIFQKQVNRSAEKSVSADKRRKTISPAAVSWTGPVFDASRSPGAQAHVDALLQHEQETKTPASEVKVASSPVRSPAKTSVSYPELPRAEKSPSPKRESARKTPPSGREQQSDIGVQDKLDEQFRGSQPSPMVQKLLRSTPNKQAATPERPISFRMEQCAEPQPSPMVQEHLRKSPTKQVVTPEKPSEPQETRKLVESIKLLSTPRKETLKSVTPRKAPAPQPSPAKTMTPRGRPTPRAHVKANSSPARQLSHDMLKVQSSGQHVEKVHLQSFLEQANIRFMDITATKRRLTTMPTPSKARKESESDAFDDETRRVDLAGSVVAAACTQPEHDMYQHACHELKHYISEGKKFIKQLEAETYQDTPPLIAAYTTAPAIRKAELDTQMRDMKTHARLRSKEIWYAWRSQLLEDLMKALSGIGEGMIKDDEVLRHAEGILEQTLPPLVEQHESLEQEAGRLQEAAASTNEEEKEELEAARARIVEVDAEYEEKQQTLAELQRESQEQEELVSNLQESKVEFAAAIQEAERVRESCRGVSLNEIATLKDSLKTLETEHGWSMTSTSSSPPTITVTYKNSLQLFFHPDAFLSASHEPPTDQPNSPISLTYVARDRKQQPKDLSTTLRFFLQLLRASLHAIPQCTTTAKTLLNLVSTGWDTATTVSESERRLNLECMTESRIVSDERLAIESTFLLPKVKTKIRNTFEITASVTEDLEMDCEVGIATKVVYGEAYDEKKMSGAVGKQVGAGIEGWADAVRDLKARLVAQGTKGMKK